MYVLYVYVIESRYVYYVRARYVIMCMCAMLIRHALMRIY